MENKEKITTEDFELKKSLSFAFTLMKKKKEIEYMESEILYSIRQGRFDKIKHLCDKYKHEFDEFSELENKCKLGPSIYL